MAARFPLSSICSAIDFIHHRSEMLLSFAAKSALNTGIDFFNVLVCEMNIFVAKLNFQTTSEDLQALFEEFGQVDSAKVVTDTQTGRTSGFAFVEMPNVDEAQAAIANLNEAEVDGRTIVVKKAEPRIRTQTP
jgi:RNA recognition motif-containing protein